MPDFKTPKALVEELSMSLSAPNERAETFAAAFSDDLPDFGEAVEQGRAFVSAGSVISFTEGLDADARRDVLESTLFAQLAANAKAERMVDPASWYQHYGVVLQSMGWSVSSFALQRRSFRRLDVDLANEALDIIEAAIGGVTLKVLETALSSMRELVVDGGGLLTLFEGSASQDTVANFQLGQVTAEEDGSLTMPMGIFYFRSFEEKKNFLFVSWSSDRVTLTADAQVLSLNRNIYSLLRDKVRERLGTITRSMVDRVELRI